MMRGFQILILLFFSQLATFGQAPEPINVDKVNERIERKRAIIRNLQKGPRSDSTLRELAKTILSTSWEYMAIGNYDSSIAIGYRAMAIAEEHQFIELLPEIYHNLGTGLQDVNQYTKTKEFIEKYNALPKEIQNIFPKFRMVEISYIEHVYGQDSSRVRLKEFVDKALAEGDTIPNLNIIRNYSMVFFNLDRSETGDSILNIIWKYRFQDERHLIPTYYSLKGAFLADLGEPELGLLYLDTAMEIAVDQRIPDELEEIYELKIWIHSLLGNWQAAYKDLKAYKEFSDSVFGFNQVELIENLNTKYETEKKERMIKDQEDELQRASLIRNLLFVFIFVILAFALLLIRNYNQKKRLVEQQLELSHRKVDDLIRDQRIRSIEAMMKGQEEERQRLARDLHDRLGGMLSTVKLQFSGFGDRNGTTEDQGFVKAVHMLDEASREVRRISHDLASGTLENMGLVSTLEQLQETIENSGRINMELNVFGLDDRLEPSLELELYRIIQELVSNTLKHANARNISLSLTANDGVLNLIFEDDGKGFDYNKVKEKKGLGLSNIPMRVEKMNGTFTVDSSSGNGATFIIDVPLV